jgi:hypothetical protein
MHLVKGTPPVDELIRKLQETRTARLKAMREAHTASAESLAAGKPKEERAAHDAAYEAAKADVDEIDVQIERRTEDVKREGRSAALAAATGGTGDQDGSAGGAARVTSEPQVYGRGSGNSFFLDQGRAEIQHNPEAAARLQRHQQEMDVELPKRREARAKRAIAAAEKLMTRSRREERAYERMLGSGVQVFQGGQEKRAIGRTDGQGGYFVPPVWGVAGG